MLCGDGCLQEGVALEALSICAHQQLDKFILLFDSNDIQLDGETNMTISENTKAKYEAMGFNYILVEDGNSVEKISHAISLAKSQNEKPSFIEVRTVIGYGSNMEGTCACHGAPIGEENSNLIRSKFGWDYPPFEIPSDLYEEVKTTISSLGGAKYAKWVEAYKLYQEKYRLVKNDF
mgnify:FL=1